MGDREHKETRLTLEATQIKSEELINKVQNPRNTSSTQWRCNSSTTTSARREKPDGREEVQCWIGHEPATNYCETVPNHHEDCVEKESVHPEK